MKGGSISVGIVILLLFACFQVGAIEISNEECSCNNIVDDPIIKTNSGDYALGWLATSLAEEPNAQEPIVLEGNAPSSWDWRDKDGINWNTPIRDQAECGSCWAFGAVACLEAIYNIQNNDPNLDIDLSEQFLVSCSMSFPYRNEGCCGGYMSDTLIFMKNKGTILETCFPYEAVDADGRDAEDCYTNDPSHDPVKCTDRCSEWQSQIIKAGSYEFLYGMDSIKTAVSSYGPVIAAFLVYSDFKEYEGGIYHHDHGQFLGGHIVSIVGYNDAESYWICKNSWGPDWGEDGYFRIGYGECGIDSNCAYFPSYTKTKSYVINPSVFQILQKMPFLQYLLRNILTN